MSDTIYGDLKSDALFLAHVWETIRSSGYESIIEHGDPDGIDFVAKRILREAAEQNVQLTAAGVESDGENQDSGGN